eukprot:GHVR01165372.1.p1 GENE.GHVR01165372.1~~GHVR01165372.1.p1  ORF type:complete len:114 (-),score=24.81 GHVR01165372.1:197-538(-)
MKDDDAPKPGVVSGHFADGSSHPPMRLYRRLRNSQHNVDLDDDDDDTPDEDKKNEQKKKDIKKNENDYTFMIMIGVGGTILFLLLLIVGKIFCTCGRVRSAKARREIGVFPNK